MRTLTAILIIALLGAGMCFGAASGGRRVMMSSKQRIEKLENELKDLKKSMDAQEAKAAAEAEKTSS